MLSILFVMYKALYTTTVLAILMSNGTDAEASGTLRCKGQIVDVGDPVASVLALCGEPEARIVNEVPIRAGSRTRFTRYIGCTTAEQWIYDRGWGKFPAVLHVDAGTIRRIDYLPRRSGD